MRDSDELDDVLYMVAGYFAVLSEPMRLRIVRAICSQEKSVMEIVEELGATQTNVSRHLSLMHRGKLVTRRKEGSRVYYRIADPQLVEICRTVCTQLAATMTDAQPAEKKLLRLMPAAKRRAARGADPRPRRAAKAIESPRAETVASAARSVIAVDPKEERNSERSTQKGIAQR